MERGVAAKDQSKLRGSVSAALFETRQIRRTASRHFAGITGLAGFVWAQFWRSSESRVDAPVGVREKMQMPRSATRRLAFTQERGFSCLYH